MNEGLLTGLDDGKRWLLVLAAPAEARAVIAGLRGSCGESSVAIGWRLLPVSERIDLVVTGVGKANAAAGLAHVFDPARHGGVLSLGVGGARPGRGLKVGQRVVATASAYGDEGVLTPDGFCDIASMGFGPGDGAGIEGVSVEGNPDVVSILGAVADQVGIVATVSTCSGTDEAALRVVERTGAIVEAMEGAAVGFTARRLGGEGVRFGELRVISNTTGDRGNQSWDLAAALAGLGTVAALL